MTLRSLPQSQMRVHTANLARRVESLEVHRRGLEQAMAPFENDESRAREWHRVFSSKDPKDVVARNGVTGCYSAIVNNYVELLKTGAYLAELTSHKRDHTRETIELVREDGAITTRQAECLHQLFVFEGRVQHASLAVGADEVLEAVELLRAEAPALIGRAVSWLEHHGIAIAGP
jgi:hypothetical protein